MLPIYCRVCTFDTFQVRRPWSKRAYGNTKLDLVNLTVNSLKNIDYETITFFINENNLDYNNIFNKFKNSTTRIIEANGSTKSLIEELKLVVSERNKEDKVYLVEDDYYHVKNIGNTIDVVLDELDFITLYDHPDLYTDFKKNYNLKDIKQDIKIIANHHWRKSEFTTHTFATKVKNIITNFDLLCKYAHDDTLWWKNCPGDLYNAIPSMATAMEEVSLPKCVDWRFNE